MHVWRLAEWHKIFPTAALWAPPQIPQQFKRISFTGVLQDEPPKAWANDFDQLVFRGNCFIDEVYFRHKPSRTVIFGDFIQNHLPVKGHPFLNTLLRFAGVTYPDGGVPIDIKWSFTNRDAARLSLRKLLAWDFDKLIIAHGVCVKSDARSFVQRAFRWLED